MKGWARPLRFGQLSLADVFSLQQAVPKSEPSAPTADDVWEGLFEPCPGTRQHVPDIRVFSSPVILLGSLATKYANPGVVPLPKAKTDIRRLYLAASRYSTYAFHCLYDLRGVADD